MNGEQRVGDFSEYFAALICLERLAITCAVLYGLQHKITSIQKIFPSPTDTKHPKDCPHEQLQTTDVATVVVVVQNYQ